MSNHSWCQKCGSQNAYGANFCCKCGTPVSLVGHKITSKKNKVVIYDDDGDDYENKNVSFSLDHAEADIQFEKLPKLGDVAFSESGKKSGFRRPSPKLPRGKNKILEILKDSVSSSRGKGLEIED